MRIFIALSLYVLVVGGCNSMPTEVAEQTVSNEIPVADNPVVDEPMEDEESVVNEPVEEEPVVDEPTVDLTPGIVTIEEARAVCVPDFYSNNGS